MVVLCKVVKGELSLKVESLDMDLIVPNKEQPRYRFNSEGLDELEKSIERNGIIQPIVVKKIGSTYRIIAGERRWRAAMKLNMRKIPAIVRDVDSDKEMEIAIVENLQREDLNPIEEARAIKRYIEKTGSTQEEVSKILGKSRPYISNIMRLLNLPSNIAEDIELGKISSGHGRALLSVKEDLQQQLLERVKLEALSVRELEQIILDSKKKEGVLMKDKSKRVKKKRDIFIEDLEEKISSSMGMKVSIDRGRIQISYNSNDELEKISKVLLKED